ncbi:uncharacterized protein [Rutidosis leptorrhynchoides]|uniref:uncharacterized protein n=1 Tax=Rutidosis leptorrhynchoides TaxID=125765 RepID=UPI003A98EFE3
MAPSVLKNHSNLMSKTNNDHEIIHVEANMIHKWQAGQRRKAETLEDSKQELIAFPSLFNTNPFDPLVVTEARITNCIVGGIYTDTGVGADIMCEHCFVQLPEIVKETILVPLASFANNPSWSEGSILLEVVLGKSPYKRIAHIEFHVVKANSQYNVILGRSAMMTFGAVTSTVHGMMKFPTPAGVAMMYAEWRRAIEFSLNPAFPDPKIIIGNTLTKVTKEKLYNILAANLDVSAWQVSDMTRVPRHIAEHMHNVNLNIPPVCQKKRGMAPEWDINKACPKDNYPLPEIDWKAKSLAGYHFKFFFDAYKGYHQILMTARDEDKAAFH